MATNLTYSIDCDFNIYISELENRFSIFPNPNKGAFKITLAESSNHISIYDLKGISIYSKKLPQGEHVINIEKAGFYYLEVNDYQYKALIVN